MTVGNANKDLGVQLAHILFETRSGLTNDGETALHLVRVAKRCPGAVNVVAETKLC